MHWLSVAQGGAGAGLGFHAPWFLHLVLFTRVSLWWASVIPRVRQKSFVQPFSSLVEWWNGS